MTKEEPPTVFIVDDDEAIRFAISMLVETCGWRARAYGSAEEFLKAHGESREAGCLVLDLNMPEVSGAELLEKTAMWLPVIVITGYADSPLAKRAREAGVRAVLKKPFSDELLLGHIRQALGITD